MGRRRQTPDEPDSSGALSLFELRRQMLKRAGALSARARGLQRQGARSTAARMAAESDRLLLVAKTMAEKNKRTSS